MIDAYINGIRQIPGVDYVATPNQLQFSCPPAAGSEIEIQQAGGSVRLLFGDGFTYLWHMDFDTKHVEQLYDLMKDALKYSSQPAVADVLRQLKTVVELVKE